jgi:hypothetical protein
MASLVAVHMMLLVLLLGCCCYLYWYCCLIWNLVVCANYFQLLDIGLYFFLNLNHVFLSFCPLILCSYLPFNEL